MHLQEIIIQCVSLLTTIVGIYFVSEKNKNGFILYIISLLCQLFLFYKNQYWFLVFQMVILILCNILTYLKWRKGEKEKFNEY